MKSSVKQLRLDLSRLSLQYSGDVSKVISEIESDMLSRKVRRKLSSPYQLYGYSLEEKEILDRSLRALHYRQGGPVAFLNKSVSGNYVLDFLHPWVKVSGGRLKRVRRKLSDDLYSSAKSLRRLKRLLVELPNEHRKVLSERDRTFEMTLIKDEMKNNYESCIDRSEVLIHDSGPYVVV